MRRIILKGAPGVYHVMSRTAYQTFSIEDEEKEQFVKLLRKVAAFCGIDVLAYCIMTNHFHALVHVPPEPQDDAISNEELIRRYFCLYTEKFCPPSSPKPSVVKRILQDNTSGAAELRQRLLRRMHNLPGFMQTLKQRYTLWYNHTHPNHGTLWAERYKSVLVEDVSSAMGVVAAYIELNSVRAGMALRPEGFRWCSLSAAMSGDAQAREGIKTVTGCAHWQDALRRYQSWIYVGEPNVNERSDHDPEDSGAQSLGTGEDLRSTGKLGQQTSVARSISSEEGSEAGRESFAGNTNDQRPHAQRNLRRRIRSLTESKVIGSAEFIARHTGADPGSIERPRKRSFTPSIFKGIIALRRSTGRPLFS